jgi:signal transduction histidine kinase
MDFTAVAHDLRSPLHVMLGHMHLLAAEQLTDTGRQRLEILEAQVQRMMRLLEQWDGGQAAATASRTVDVGTLIRNLVGELAPLFSVHGIEVTANIDGTLPPVAGDTDSLYRALLNIAVNAAEAIADDGKITIAARMARPPLSNRPPMVHVEVADTGSGMAADVLPHVFKRGFTTKPPGESHGLGLDICREIIEMHAGQIHLASAPGAGTTVHLFLPPVISTAPRDRA